MMRKLVRWMLLPTVMLSVRRRSATMTQEMHMGVNLGREGVEIMRTLKGFVSGGKERWQWARL